MGDFSTGLFSCCDDGCGACCKAFFCPCILFGETMEKLAATTDNVYIKDKNPNCILYAALCFVTFYWYWLPLGLYHGWARNLIRHKGEFNFDTYLEDFAVAWCCNCCAVHQEHKQMQS